MNLNTIKRGFTKTEPERGLKNLLGSRKSEHRDGSNQPSNIRVKGRYIENSHDSAGKIVGLLAFVIACLCNLLIVLSVLQLVLPFGQTITTAGFFILLYATLGVIMHAMVIIADGMRNSNAPWARKSIMVFWSGLALFITAFLSINMFMSLLT